MKRYRNTILTVSIIPLFLSACLFSADRNNPNDYKNGGGWSKPAVLSLTGDPNGSCERLSLGMSADGTAIAAWRQHNTQINKYRIFVNKVHANDSASWEGILQIDGPVDTTESDLPDVAVNQFGDAVIAWVESANTGDNYIWSESFPYGSPAWDNSQWGSIPAAGGAVQFTPNSIQHLRVAVNDTFNDAVFSWSDNTGQILATSYSADKSIPISIQPWSSTNIISLPMLTNQRASVLMVSRTAGTWYLDDRWVEMSSAGTWMVDNLYVSSDTLDNKEPAAFDMDSDSAGNGIFIYTVLENNYLDGRSFSPTQIFSSQMQINDSAVFVPKVAINKYGDHSKAVIVYRDENNHVHASTVSFAADMSIMPTTYWGSPIDETQMTERYGLDVAMDAEGNAVVVYRKNSMLYASRLNAAAKSWSAPVLISDKGRTLNWDDASYLSSLKFQPHVAMDKDGNTVAIWIEDQRVCASVYRN